MYKAVSRDSQFIRFQRIDSTLGLFYNIGSYQFSDGEDIYSYGGYGFWKTNGLLRKFNFRQGEWDVVPLDREIIAQYNPTNLIWYDAASRQLHVPFQQFVNDGVKQIRHKVGEVDERSWVLDVPTRKWSQSGVVNPALLNAAERANAEVHYETQNGLVIENLFQLIRLDYSSNIFSQTGIHPVTQTLNRHNLLYDLEYLIGDTVYYMNSETGKEDSVYVGGLPIMDSAELVQETNTVPIVASSLLVIAAGVLLIVRSRKRRDADERKADSIDKVVDSSDIISDIEPSEDEIAEVDEEDLVLKQSIETTPVQLPEVSIASPFNATEKEVILLCLQRSEAGGHVDLEEINHVLGIKNKSKGLQKKVRSEVFNSINNKFRAFSNTSSGLIESVRNKNDKRYFDYFIEAGHFSAVKQLLDS
jgi:hypothetical protein